MIDYNELATKALNRNAKKAGNVVDWRSTRIGATDGARASNPWRELGVGVTSSNVDPDIRRLRCTLKNLIASSTPRTSSYGRDDAVYIRKFLLPDLKVHDAIPLLETRLANRQGDDTAWGYWCGLRNYLLKLPTGSRIRDANPRAVAGMIRELEGNLIKY